MERRAGVEDGVRVAFGDVVADLASFGWAAFRLRRELIGLRRRCPWLHRARSRVTELRNAHLVIEAFHGENRLWVALNLTDAPIASAIPAAVDKLAGDLAVRRKGGMTEITLPPHGWGILATQSDGSNV